jgi:hypothetical protein
MGEIVDRQIYDLLLDVSRRVAELDASVDELLTDMRMLNREAVLPVRRAGETPQNFSRDFLT